MAHCQCENVGWNRTAYADPDLDWVQRQMAERGFRIQEWDVAPFVGGFSEYIKLPEYSGSYREYGGKDVCSFLEKALEHFVSIKITRPASGQVFMDVGSCVSVVPDLLRRYYGCDCYVQDLDFRPGVHGWNIGSNAAEIPLPVSILDGMTLQCTYEHFEGNADSQFIRNSTAHSFEPGGGGETQDDPAADAYAAAIR